MDQFTAPLPPDWRTRLIGIPRILETNLSNVIDSETNPITFTNDTYIYMLLAAKLFYIKDFQLTKGPFEDNYSNIVVEFSGKPRLTIRGAFIHFQNNYNSDLVFKKYYDEYDNILKQYMLRELSQFEKEHPEPFITFEYFWTLG